jgi:protein-S-isoprenylcysteine O-methyltransferase Ste14
LITRWHIESNALWSLPLKILGATLVLAGLAVLTDSFVRFAIKGLGTPAPPLPTRHLVVSGLYRYVRNPMYVAVAAAIFGQALVFGNRTLLVYGAFVCLCFHLFVIAYEEPSLRARFGAEYSEFCAAVPRWIPRLSPWQGEGADSKPQA